MAHFYTSMKFIYLFDRLMLCGIGTPAQQRSPMLLCRAQPLQLKSLPRLSLHSVISSQPVVRSVIPVKLRNFVNAHVKSNIMPTKNTLTTERYKYGLMKCKVYVTLGRKLRKADHSATPLHSFPLHSSQSSLAMNTLFIPVFLFSVIASTVFAQSTFTINTP